LREFKRRNKYKPGDIINYHFMIISKKCPWNARVSIHRRDMEFLIENTDFLNRKSTQKYLVPV